MPKWKLGDEYMPQKSEAFLWGIPAIATYFGKSYNTIIRWIEKGYLPAAKDPKGRWFTTKSLIDQWIVASHRAEIDERARRLFKGIGPDDPDDKRPGIRQPVQFGQKVDSK